MLKILMRFLNIFKAKANTVVDQMENPIESYQLAISEYETALLSSEKAIAIAMGDLKLKQNDLEKFKLEVEQRTSQAKAALLQSREDLAQAALEMKGNAMIKVTEYTTLANMLNLNVTRLRKEHEKHKKGLETTRAKYTIFKGKYETAKAQRAINESLSTLGGNTALSNLERYEEKINQLSAEAESLSEMRSESTRVDDELQTIEIDAQVVDEMELLKIEAQFEKVQKEKQKQEKINKLILGQIPDTKIINITTNSNPITLLDALPTKAAPKNFDEFFKK